MKLPGVLLILVVALLTAVGAASYKTTTLMLTNTVFTTVKTISVVHSSTTWYMAKSYPIVNVTMVTSIDHETVTYAVSAITCMVDYSCSFSLTSSRTTLTWTTTRLTTVTVIAAPSNDASQSMVLVESLSIPTAASTMFPAKGVLQATNSSTMSSALVSTAVADNSDNSMILPSITSMRSTTSETASTNISVGVTISSVITTSAAASSNSSRAIPTEILNSTEVTSSTLSVTIPESPTSSSVVSLIVTDSTEPSMSSSSLVITVTESSSSSGESSSSTSTEFITITASTASSVTPMMTTISEVYTQEHTKTAIATTTATVTPGLFPDAGGRLQPPRIFALLAGFMRMVTRTTTTVTVDWVMTYPYYPNISVNATAPLTSVFTTKPSVSTQVVTLTSPTSTITIGPTVTSIGEAVMPTMGCLLVVVVGAFLIL